MKLSLVPIIIFAAARPFDLEWLKAGHA